MEFVYKRKINYYETDKMGVVHHSNYIRFMEEARCRWLEHLEMPFESFEEKGITIPVIGVSCEYKQHVTFGDVVVIKVFAKAYSGVRMSIGYEITEEKSGKVVLFGETKHCFTDKNLNPIALRRFAPEIDEKFNNLLKENDQKS